MSLFDIEDDFSDSRDKRKYEKITNNQSNKGEGFFKIVLSNTVSTS